jgi:hypothetical protein
MLDRFRLRRSDGQTLVVFAVALPMLFAVLALVVDGSNLMVQRRSIQNAADAAALAAAQELGPGAGCDAACLGRVQLASDDYGHRNGISSSVHLHQCNNPSPANPTDTNCFAAPYVDKRGVTHDGFVEVRLRRQVSTFFASAVGLSHVFDVSARAVASSNPEIGVVTSPGSTSLGLTNTGSSIPGTTDPGTTITNTTTIGGGAAILFARCGLAGVGVSEGCKSSAPCTALHISGSNNVFRGAIWSDGGVQDSGQNYGSPAQTPPGNATLYYSNAYGAVGTSCVVTNNAWWADIQRKAPIDWPVPLPTLTCSDASTGTSCPTGTHATHVNGVACTYVGDKYTVTTVLAAGLYCAGSQLTVNKAGLTITNVGYIAPAIQWSSGTNVLKGYTGLYSQYGGLIFDAYGSGGLNQSGSSNAFTGAIFAPFGNAQISGGGQQAACGSTGTNAAACGFIEGATVQLSGSGGSWQGLGPIVGGTTTVSTTTVFGTTNAGTTVPGTTRAGTTIPGSTNTVITGTTIGMNE